MTFLKLPLVLAAVMMLRRVDASCVEDNCYGALYWNPAGAEECSDHFVTTVVPAPSTATLTITSAVAEATTITGESVGASTIIPSQAIPTYIVRACYGDVTYRFESACSCIEAGPTTTIAAVPTVTDTVVLPFTQGSGISPPPPVSPPPVSLPSPLSPLPPLSSLPLPTLPASGSAPSIVDPTCVDIPGPVIVTVQVDKLYMTLTMAGSTLCLGETTAPPAQPSGCNCASTLPCSASWFSSSTRFANATSFSSTGSFSTVLRTTSSTGYSNRSSTVATRPEPSASEEERTSTAAPTLLETSQSQTFGEPTTQSLITESSIVEPSTSLESSVEPSAIEETSGSPSSTVEPSSTAEFSSAVETSNAETSTSKETSGGAPSSTVEPLSSTQVDSTTTLVPSTTTTTTATTTTTTTTTTDSSQGPSRISTSATSGPTHFIPHGPVVLLQVASGTLLGQYIVTDQPDETESRPSNLRSGVTPDTERASVWTLDAATGILFQQINGAWWGAYFGFGSRSQWGTILLFPADTVVSWLAAPVALKAPLRCVIDYTAGNLMTCGQQLWTNMSQSDKCGWAITTPFNPSYAAACPGSVEVYLQAIEVSTDQDGIGR